MVLNNYSMSFGDGVGVGLNDHSRSAAYNKVVESYQVWSNVRWDTFDASSSTSYTVKLRQKSSKHVLSMKSEKLNFKITTEFRESQILGNTVTGNGRI